MPKSWDLVRRAVDEGAAPGRFLLTGSAQPAGLGTHSGAARIVSVRMRPLAIAERDITTPTVSLQALLTGAKAPVHGHTDLRLKDYTNEILASGLPGLRDLSGRALRAQLDGYLLRIVDRDFPELGRPVRNPAALRRWMTAYATASSTTASFEKIRDAHRPAATERSPRRRRHSPIATCSNACGIPRPDPRMAANPQTASRDSQPHRHRRTPPPRRDHRHPRRTARPMNHDGRAGVGWCVGPYDPTHDCLNGSPTP